MFLDMAFAGQSLWEWKREGRNGSHLQIPQRQSPATLEAAGVVYGSGDHITMMDATFFVDLYK